MNDAVRGLIRFHVALTKAAKLWHWFLMEMCTSIASSDPLDDLDQKLILSHLSLDFA